MAIIIHSAILITPFSIRFYDHMKACIQEAPLPLPPEAEKIYDPRFFSCKNSTGRCLSGEVREIVTSVLQTRRPTFMEDESWIDSARKQANPFSRNSLLKHVCMNRIASGGLKSLDRRLDSMNFRYFEDFPDWSKLTFQKYQNQSEERYLFIAEQFLRVGIDGIAAHLDWGKRIIELFFIQIGYTSKSRNADEDFFRQHYCALKRSLLRDQDASRCTIQVSYIHIGDQRSSGLSPPVRRKFIGEEFDIEYNFHDIPLTILDNRLRHT